MVEPGDHCGCDDVIPEGFHIIVNLNFLRYVRLVIA